MMRLIKAWWSAANAVSLQLPEPLNRSLRSRDKQLLDLTRISEKGAFPLLDTRPTGINERFQPNRIINWLKCEGQNALQHGHFAKAIFGSTDSKDSAFGGLAPQTS